MAELQLIIVFHRRHYVRHLGICNPICVKLLQIMSSVIPRHLKQKRRPYHKSFSWRPQTRHIQRQTHTHTNKHTHDDSIRRNAMRCISPNEFPACWHLERGSKILWQNGLKVMACVGSCLRCIQCLQYKDYLKAFLYCQIKYQHHKRSRQYSIAHHLQTAIHCLLQNNLALTDN